VEIGGTNSSGYEYFDYINPSTCMQNMLPILIAALISMLSSLDKNLP
jgi:hypothetical protein